MSDVIMVAIITGGLGLIGNIIGNYLFAAESTALITYRIDQLENKVNKHNNLIERTYALENGAKFSRKN